MCTAAFGVSPRLREACADAEARSEEETAWELELLQVVLWWLGMLSEDAAAQVCVLRPSAADRAELGPFLLYSRRERPLEARPPSSVDTAWLNSRFGKLVGGPLFSSNGSRRWLIQRAAEVAVRGGTGPQNQESMLLAHALLHARIAGVVDLGMGTAGIAPSEASRWNAVLDAAAGVMGLNAQSQLIGEVGCRQMEPHLCNVTTEALRRASVISLAAAIEASQSGRAQGMPNVGLVPALRSLHANKSSLSFLPELCRPLVPTCEKELLLRPGASLCSLLHVPSCVPLSPQTYLVVESVSANRRPSGGGGGSWSKD